MWAGTKAVQLFKVWMNKKQPVFNTLLPILGNIQTNTPYISLHRDFHTQTRAKAEARTDKSYCVILFYEQMMIKVYIDLTENKWNMELT